MGILIYFLQICEKKQKKPNIYTKNCLIHFWFVFQILLFFDVFFLEKFEGGHFFDGHSSWLSHMFVQKHFPRK